MLAIVSPVGTSSASVYVCVYGPDPVVATAPIRCLRSMPIEWYEHSTENVPPALSF